MCVIDIHVPGQQQTMTIPLGIGYDDKLPGVKNAVSLFVKLMKSLINVSFVFEKPTTDVFYLTCPRVRFSSSNGIMLSLCKITKAS